MNTPRLDPTISVGNIIVAVTVIFGIGVAWAITQERGANNATAIAEIRSISASAIAEVRSDARNLETRVRVLENTIAAQTGQLSTIIASQTELKGDMRRLLEMTP
jgi:hypothetical protein